MRYFSREDQDKAAAELIAAYREAASLFPSIRTVFEQFNGKCYNKRIDKALTLAACHVIHSEKRFQTLHFYCYGSAGRIHTLASIHENDMPDGKRLDASKLIESARTCRAEALRRAAEIEQVSEQVDRILDQLKQIDDMVKAIVDPISWEARDIWNLNARLEYR